MTLPSACNSYVVSYQGCFCARKHGSVAPWGALTGQAGGGFTFVLCILSGGHVLAGFVFVAVVQLFQTLL